jgi:hypothetical protein
MAHHPPASGPGHPWWIRPPPEHPLHIPGKNQYGGRGSGQEEGKKRFQKLKSFKLETEKFQTEKFQTEN